jgi:hypothetical protein
MEATNAPAKIVGHRVEGGWLCLDPLCRKPYADAEIGRPVIEGDASDESGFYSCRSCVETLDQRTEVIHWLRAPSRAASRAGGVA